MAITTLDGALAGFQPPKPFWKAVSGTLVAGRPFSPWYTLGFPGPGTADTSTATGIARSSTSALVNGQIPYYDPGGANNAYLARFVGAASQAGTLHLVDRIWDCGANSAGGALSPTVTTSQTINSTTWPSRDADGSTNGKGILAGLEISSLMGAGTPNVTITYTNSGGTGSHTANTSVAITAASAVGSFYPYALQAGDVGIRSIQSVQNSATLTSGQYILVAYRILASLELSSASVSSSLDLITGGFPQLYNGTVPTVLFQPSTTTTSSINGMMIVSQG